MSLLEQAKKIPRRMKKKWGKEHFELTEAWLNEEINLTQIAQVIGRKNKNPNVGMYMVMSCLREMKREGLIKIVKK